MKPKNKTYIWTLRDICIHLSCLLDVTFHYQLRLYIGLLRYDVERGRWQFLTLNLSEFHFSLEPNLLLILLLLLFKKFVDLSLGHASIFGDDAMLVEARQKQKETHCGYKTQNEWTITNTIALWRYEPATDTESFFTVLNYCPPWRWFVLYIIKWFLLGYWYDWNLHIFSKVLFTS